MKKLFEWLKTSSRWKHLLGVMCIGLGANNWYCAGYAGLVAAGALEFKDKAHGGEWDWIDFGLTAAGAIVGHTIRAVL